MLHPDHIEAALFSGDVEGAAVDEGHSPDSDGLGEHTSCVVIGGGELESGDLRPELGSERSGWSAQAAAEIDDLRALPDAGELGQSESRRPATDVELGASREIGGGELAGVLAAFFEGTENQLTEIRGTVLRAYCGCQLGCAVFAVDSQFLSLFRHERIGRYTFATPCPIPPNATLLSRSLSPIWGTYKKNFLC